MTTLQSASWDFAESFDDEDVVTLEPFCELQECDVVKFVLPDSEHRGGKKYRCCRKDTFAQFYLNATKSVLFLHKEAETAADYEDFLSTALVGMDMLAYDTDFVLRHIDAASGSQHPLVLHVSHVRRVEPRHVKDPIVGLFHDHRQQVVVNLHCIQEAIFERALWQILDDFMSDLTHGRCGKGHVLKPINPPVPWVCDRCERHFTRATRPYRCSRGCDFDLCDLCISLPSQVQDVSTRFKCFEQKLLDARSRSRFPLSARPPQDRDWDDRQQRWIVRLSQRVTKWNYFELDADISSNLRKRFMSALEVEESSFAWMDFRPGAGLEPPILLRDLQSFTLRAKGLQLLYNCFGLALGLLWVGLSAAFGLLGLLCDCIGLVKKAGSKLRSYCREILKPRAA